MKRKVIIIFLFILLVLIIATAFIVLIQQSLFFYPNHNAEAHKILSEHTEFEEISIEYKKGEHVYGWLKYNVDKEEQSPLLIFFGGNAQSASNTALFYLQNNIYKYYEGYNILMIDYPGYGLSEGTPSDKNMFDSALKIYDYIVDMKMVDKSNIVVMGFSIGTGVATYLSSQREVNGLILLAPYDRGLSLYNGALNIFHGPLKLLARYKFNSLEYAKDVTVKPLIAFSYDDEVISYQLAENLVNYFNETYKVVTLNNVKHNYIITNLVVLEEIQNYLIITGDNKKVK